MFETRKTSPSSPLLSQQERLLKGGLNPKVSYTLSDLYIQRLEKLNYIEAIDSLLEEAVYDFTERVHQINHENYSKEVIHTKNIFLIIYMNGLR